MVGAEAGVVKLDETVAETFFDFVVIVIVASFITALSSDPRRSSTEKSTSS